MILLANVVGGDTGAELVGRLQDLGQINVGGLCGAQFLSHAKLLGTTNHLIDGAETKLGHDCTELVGDVVEEVDDVLGCTSELLPELRVLGGNTDRASVEMALVVVSK